MSDRDQSPGAAGANPEEQQPKTEHLNIKVTDNNNEVFFKIKRTTQLSKLMNAFCDRQGKQLSSVRFLFDGARVQPTDSPESVCRKFSHSTFPFLWQTTLLGGKSRNHTFSRNPEADARWF
jgi:small ubiquitin-related modifier